MDIKFDQLISCSIKRLTRPTFRNEFPTFFDSKTFADLCPQTSRFVEMVSDEQQLTDLMTRCDVNQVGVPITASMNFNPQFGKICKGEHFKVLFTIQNNSASFNLDHIDIRCVVISGHLNEHGKQINVKEQKLLSRIIP